MTNSAKFDRENVLQKAMNLFWQKGFSGTSMRDLQEVLDMRPGSIYASLGDKRQIYEQVVERYTEQSIAGMKQTFYAQNNAVEGLCRILEGCITGEDGCKVCMLAKAVSEWDDGGEPVPEFTRNALTRVRGVLAELIAEGQNRGEIQRGSHPLELAKLIQMQLISLRIMAAVESSPAALQSLLHQVVQQLVEPMAA